MKYIVLVRHGAFADGMASALRMLDGGDRSDIISVGLNPEEGAEVFKNILFGGEGLFLTVMKDPGKVWLQTVSISELAAKIRKFIPTRSN